METTKRRGPNNEPTETIRTRVRHAEEAVQRQKRWLEEAESAVRRHTVGLYQAEVSYRQQQYELNLRLAEEGGQA